MIIPVYIITWKCDGDEERFTSWDEYRGRLHTLENQGYVDDVDFYTRTDSKPIGE